MPGSPLPIAPVLALTVLVTAGCPAQPPDGWPPSDEQARFRRAAEYSRAADGASVLVMRRGRIIFEAYHNGYTAGRAHRLASGTKSFWGVAAVAAVEDGLLQLDERVGATITEWQDDPRKSRITVRQLLNFTSGLDPAQELLRGPGGDKYRLALGVETLSEPGRRFRYGPSHLCVFGELLKRKLAAAGRDPDPLHYLQQRILDPLDIHVSYWLRDRAGNPTMPFGAFLTAREWARFGEFIRNGGRYQGKQIVSAELLAECFKGSQANGAYGLTFWLNQKPGPAELRRRAGNRPRRFRPLRRGPGGRLKEDPGRPFIWPDGPSDLVMAAGAGKQRLYIIPSMELVIVRQGESERGFEDREFLEMLLGRP